MRILVTGAAGFIGSTLSHRLLERGDQVLGYDNLNDYYDPTLKQARLERLLPQAGFQFVRGSLEDQPALAKAFADFQPERVVNLAAQAGVRYSLENPHAYIQANLVGFTNILEACRHGGVEHLVYASSSSVYGANRKLPFRVDDPVDHPVSLYAATKKANELMAHTYSHLFALPTTGLRFFTVYGPWGRPDMALFLFTDRILRGEPIQVFNHGRHTRDFTYIDDIVAGVIASLDQVPGGDPAFDPLQPRPGTSSAPYRVYNIGNETPVQLERYIQIIEDKLGRKAEKILLPLQPGDVPDTHADVSDLAAATGYAPRTSVQVGVGRFIDWYRQYYQV
ncbi:MAG: NAD-dependent epimerase [Xanthomonadales bacterium]|nr:NAD-dependent epimerase [Xanthomonadales bacterium]